MIKSLRSNIEKDKLLKDGIQMGIDEIINQDERTIHFYCDNYGFRKEGDDLLRYIESLFNQMY